MQVEDKDKKLKPRKLTFDEEGVDEVALNEGEMFEVHPGCSITGITPIINPK